ncbi:MAG: Na(+)-translocating NADH-quinone reductase subunit A [Planctomycetota bacterium]|nr:Na(+)-translocating NADH-quinone reductase subunit A [Planctomycetota bacterium]
MIRISNGLNLPITGEPSHTIDSSSIVSSVALLGADYIGMKPTMAVNVGDRVKLGQELFSDKKTAGVKHTSPASGVVSAINRGAKRLFQSVVVDLDGDDEVEFTSYGNRDLTGLSREEVTTLLLNSGLWTCLRTRPFNKTPTPGSVPHSIFVTAMDTNPLSIAPRTVIEERESSFVYGLQAIRHLTDGTVFVCKAPEATLPGADLPFVTEVSFEGPHPAGLPGTHIHFLDPVSLNKTVWFLNYQDLIAIGDLFVTGRLNVDRVISIAGPSVAHPQIVKTRLAANIDQLVDGGLLPGENRVISGSVLAGREAVAPHNFLGRFHLQVSVVAEGREREFLGWQKPGVDKFSIKRVFAAGFLGGQRRFAFTTSTEGSRRAMVPIGMFEKVMPLDILPTFLLRALIVGDTEQAQLLGCLELDEEDLALCTFVCPGKTDYGPLLRANLIQIEKEG